MVRKTIKNYTTTIAVEKIVGNSKALQPLKKSFLKAIKNQNPNEIAKTTAEYVASSDTALKNLVKVTKMFDFVEEEFNEVKEIVVVDTKKIIEIFSKCKTKEELKTEYKKLTQEEQIEREVLEEYKNRRALLEIE